MIVEELLRPVFEKNDMENMEDLDRVLGAIAEESRTSRLWI